MINPEQLAALVRASDPAKDYDRGVLDLVAGFRALEVQLADQRRISSRWEESMIESFRLLRRAEAVRDRLMAVLKLAFEKRDPTAPEITFEILREALAPKAGA